MCACICAYVCACVCVDCRIRSNFRGLNILKIAIWKGISHLYSRKRQPGNIYYHNSEVYSRVYIFAKAKFLAKFAKIKSREN